MPLYEYVCANCHTRFEALRAMSQADSPIACPTCTEESTRRVMSAVAAISKGDGTSRLVTSSQSSGCSSCAGGSCATCGH